MAQEVDLTRIHDQLQAHLAAIDALRVGVQDTARELAGRGASDWDLLQLRKIWHKSDRYPGAQEVLRHLAAHPETWVAFADIVTDHRQARNEMGALRRLIKRERGRDVELFERAQHASLDYRQGYRMRRDIAALLSEVIAEDS